MSHSTTGIDALNSDEYRAFAIRWLGFDPEKEHRIRKVTGCTIEMNFDDAVRYELRCIGFQSHSEVWVK